MDNLLLYLLRVSAGTAMLYLSYLLFFSKDTFYKRNRLLLILTLLLPTIIPAIKFPIITESTASVEPLNALENIIFPGNEFETAVPGTIHSFDYKMLLVWIYFSIAGLVLLRVAISIISTFRIIKRGVVKTSHFPKVVISDLQLPPFSFFPYAVIPAEDYKSGNYNDILDHEFAHIRQWHTFDLLLSELFIALQWFNPFVWLIKRSVILNHEYLADHASLGKNSAKEYQYRLLNFTYGLKSISLAHNFNSLIKNRIIMINKKPTRKYAMMKNILILPIVATVAYAFATPEYRNIAAPPKDNTLTIYKSSAIVQQPVKGIVLKEDGKPLQGVLITSTGAVGEASGAETGPDGKFAFGNIKPEASLLFFCRGYKRLTLKPVFTAEMVVKMGIDPEYKAPTTVTGSKTTSAKRPNPIVSIDGVITEKSPSDVRKDLGYNMGITKMIMGKEAIDKYGEKGSNGVIEIITRKKALEMGLKPPFPRLAPEDFPTFQNQKFTSFTEWVANQVKYPAEAQTKRLEGWVSVTFRIELNGSISNVVSTIPVDPLLSDEVIRAVQSSPKWDPPKNPNVDEPLNSSITLKFKLPDQILKESVFVVVEQMPTFPGGDVELMNFIKDNIKYPEEAKTGKIEGRVILKFIINPEGKTEAASVIKGVHPLLDAEALRVVSILPGFKPGMQGGKPVNVWYNIPVMFSLPGSEPLFSKSSEHEILKFIVTNTRYPEEAKESYDTGRVFVVVKLNKGGITKECKAFTEFIETDVPVLQEVVIVGYGSASAKSSNNSIKGGSTKHLALKTECLRVANKLTVNEIPDWKDKDMEFALAFNFQLK